MLLDQQKIDNRTIANVEEILFALTQSNSLSQKEISTRIKSTKSSSVILNILTRLTDKNLLEFTTKPSRGAYKAKRVYSLTKSGLLLSGVLFNKDIFFENALDEYSQKIENNPMSKLGILLMQDIDSLLSKEQKANLDSLFLSCWFKAFIETQKYDEIIEAFLSETSPFKHKFIEIMNMQQLGDFRLSRVSFHTKNFSVEDQQLLFLQYKVEIENYYLRRLTGELLREYGKAISTKPSMLKLICPSCKTINYKDISAFISGSFNICEKCKSKMTT